MGRFGKVSGSYYCSNRTETIELNRSIFHVVIQYFGNLFFIDFRHDGIWVKNKHGSWYPRIIPAAACSSSRISKHPTRLYVLGLKKIQFWTNIFNFCCQFPHNLLFNARVVTRPTKTGIRRRLVTFRRSPKIHRILRLLSPNTWEARPDTRPCYAYLYLVL